MDTIRSRSDLEAVRAEKRAGNAGLRRVLPRRNINGFYGTSICDSTEKEEGAASYGQGHADRPASSARTTRASRSLGGVTEGRSITPEAIRRLVELGLANAQRATARTRKAAKASELAGQEIDRLGDPLATDEERQLRKRRLISGPKEFRNIRRRRNRPSANG